jgi:hypothetical protein
MAAWAVPALCRPGWPERKLVPLDELWWKGAEVTGPRWSILRDVLGWVD